MGNHRHSIVFQELIRIVIMQIWNSFCFRAFAAVFSEIMTGRGSGYQRQIHRNAGPRQLSGNMHRHKMHAADMTHCVVRRNLLSNPHKFNQIMTFAVFDKMQIFVPARLLFNFFRRQELHAKQRREAVLLLLIREYCPQGLQIK